MRDFHYRCGLLLLLFWSVSATMLSGQDRPAPKVRFLISDTLSQSGLALPEWKKPHTLPSLEQHAEILLEYLENHGYPFAEVRLYKPTTDAEDSVIVQVIANPLIRWDSVVLKGDAHLSPRFLYPYLKIRRGAPYREQAVTRAAAALNSLTYVEVLRPPSPSFTQESSALYVYLNKKAANQLDGFIGFGPDENGNGTTLYGQLQLRLTNMLARGEEFAVDWKRPRPENQNMQIEGALPCLLRTPFGLYGQFSMLKNDSSYHRLSMPVGFRYLLNGSNYIQMYYRYERCHTTIPSDEQGDYRAGMYGLRCNTAKTDQARIPHKGYRMDISGEVGSKTESVSGLRSTVAQGKGNAEGFLPLGRRWVQYFRLQSGLVIDKKPSLSNLFLLGGLQSLRGLDEESVTASAYTFLTGEIRFFLDRNLFLQAFADGGWYERKGAGSYRNDRPVGVGIGFSFDSRVGLLSLNYAVAAHDGQGFRLRAAKVCVGYSAVF